MDITSEESERFAAVNNATITRLAGAFFLALTPDESFMFAVRILHALSAPGVDDGSDTAANAAAVRKFATYAITQVSLTPPPATDITDFAKALIFHACPPDLAPVMVWQFVNTLMAVIAGVECDTATITERQTKVHPMRRDAALSYTRVFDKIREFYTAQGAPKLRVVS